MNLSIAPEVAKALAANKPVVALESTVIAHGLPRPRNLSTARALEAEIRAFGVVPATIALHDGVAVVGALAGRPFRTYRDDSGPQHHVERYVPDFPPVFSTRRMSVSVAPRSMDFSMS